jgi:DNA-binding NtrC family response regulator
MFTRSMLSAGRRHPDFLARIRDLEVTIPPLRACREDLPWMWRATFERVGKEARLPFECVHCHATVAIRALAKHELPVASSPATGGKACRRKALQRASCHRLQC